MRKTNYLVTALSILCTSSLTASAAVKVEDIFKANCASCHGEQLQGGMAGSLLDATWLKDGSDKSLSEAIKFGVKEKGMPAFGASLSEETIRTLVVYIREAGYRADVQAIKTPTINKRFSTKYHSVNTQEVTSTSGIIWAMDFLPDGSLLYTLREGQLWLLDKNGQSAQIKNTPEVWHRGQGGMLDVMPDPDYAQNGWVYLSYSKKTGQNKAGQDIGITAIVRGKIKNNQWVEQQTLFEAPKQTHRNRGWHFGSRFAISGEYLFFSNGDEGHQDDAQDLATQNGKVHRIYKNGQIPKDNPFFNHSKALKTIWTYGNRNPQGLVKHPITHQIWSTEHGPRGGDELNLITKGLNYGWPKITYGINYDGTPITPHTSLPGMQQPVHQWTPSIAVAGMNFYTHKLFQQWQGDLFVGSLAKKQLHRLRIKNDKVVEDEIILKGLGRIRDVVVAPNGKLYITMNDRQANESKIIALSPSK
ncbi:PQQ-dependent sugar dehydrogenase [Pseudoalteromonas luteoviolacea]|uniref:PQQ-dependent sugar dehydrogenase n=1 Tax=Pseudoalteromonas luteoviolacea TaxID=43657 RepID=UPI001151AE18|nr:PQQ-dependent sugar dehydrogenase [Pseudoalteromonas luteoviolacea]TQF67787.1 secretion protein HlyD [Pseudoalteromonas luteoviolacea]